MKTPAETASFDLRRGLDSTVRLSDGAEMPVLGLGVWRTAPGQETRGAVAKALAVGYRLIDTATLYENEADVGRALRDSGVPRERVFVTTKVWNDDQGYESTLAACAASLRRLGLEYLDLYLVHWPVPGRRLETWKALVRLKQEGKCRSIGVSNFTVAHLRELLAASEVVPSVNQVEFNPFLYQSELLEYCRAHGIQLEAYAPLTRGRHLSDDRISEIARRHGVSGAQVLVRWGLQHAVVEIPKSARPERIEENAGVFGFSLASEEMAALDALDERQHLVTDPATIP